MLIQYRLFRPFLFCYSRLFRKQSGYSTYGHAKFSRIFYFSVIPSDTLFYLNSTAALLVSSNLTNVSRNTLPMFTSIYLTAIRGRKSLNLQVLCCSFNVIFNLDFKLNFLSKLIQCSSTQTEIYLRNLIIRSFA